MPPFGTRPVTDGVESTAERCYVLFDALERVRRRCITCAAALPYKANSRKQVHERDVMRFFQERVSAYEKRGCFGQRQVAAHGRIATAASWFCLFLLSAIKLPGAGEKELDLIV